MHTVKYLSRPIEYAGNVMIFYWRTLTYDAAGLVVRISAEDCDVQGVDKIR